MAVPEPLTLLGVTDPHDKPAEGLSEIAIVPEKPFSAVSVIVDIEEEPGVTVEGEDALIVKSRKLRVVVAEWVSVPLDALIVS